MWIFTAISGFFWLLFSSLILAFEMSISGGSSTVSNAKTIITVIVIAGFFCGIYMIYLATAQKRRKYYLKLEKNLINELISEKYSVLSFRLSAKTGIRLDFLEKFIYKRTIKCPDFVFENNIITFRNEYTKHRKK